MNKVLITGISGFVGSHLAQYLIRKNYQVYGTYLDDSSLDNLPFRDKLNLFKVNLLEEDSVRDLVGEVKPDFIYHLAALTSTRKSFSNPKETFINNISAQIDLLESVLKFNLAEAKILIVSSAEVYGLVSKENLPIDEETPYKPTNPYAVSKLAQDFLGLEYQLSKKMKIVRVRPFNHIGPRQSDAFVVGAFCKRIVEIEKGKEEKMKVGNLSSKRDFTDVRDMVKAYELALTKGKDGEVYNIGSGKSYAISEILEMLKSMSTKNIEVVKDESVMILSDNPELTCDYSKFNKLTGWKPEIPIEKTLKDTLDYWRTAV